MSNYSLKAQAAYLFVGKAVGYCVRVIAPIILVRLLTTAEYGIYRQILFISVVVLLLMRLRLPESLYYFFPRVNGQHGKLLSQTLSLLIVTSLLGMALFLITGWVFHFLPRQIPAKYVLPIAVYLLFESLAYILDHIFILEKMSRMVAMAAVGNQVFRLFFVVGAALVFRSVLAIVYALIVFSGIRLLIILVYLLKKYAIRLGISDVKLLKEQARYIVPLAASGILEMVGNQIDKGIIAALMLPEDFAIYMVGGLGIMALITMLYISVGDVCLPRFGELAIENNFEVIRGIWHKMIVINSVVTIPAVCFLFTFAEEIITFLYTDKYVASTNILRINLLTLFMQMLMYGRIATALGRTKAIFLAMSVRTAVAIPLSYFFIVKFGLLGGVVGYATAFWISGIILLYVSGKETKSTFRMLLPWKQLLTIFLISIVPAIVLSCFLESGMSNLQTLLIAGPVYFAVVAIALKLTGYIKIKEFRNILSKSKP